MSEGAAGVSKKSHAGDDRGIPPFKKRRVGHPAGSPVAGGARMPGMEDADKLAQDVVNGWAVNVDAGNGALITAEYRVLLEKACLYQSAKQVADSWRAMNSLLGRAPDDATNASVAAENAKRDAFLKEYSAFSEKHPHR